MQQVFKNAVETFINNNLESIRKFAGWFAKSVTLNIMNNNSEELKKLCENSTYMRSDIEFTESITMTKEYYFGYCSAYENVARKLLEEENSQENIEIIVKTLPQLRLYKIINFLGEQGYVQQNELASYLQISASHLWNILNNPSVKELNIFSVNKIGKHSIYGLNKKGKQYYQDKIDQNNKQYSKKEILDLLSKIISNYDTFEDVDVYDVTKLDEDLSRELYKRIYEKISESKLRNDYTNNLINTYPLNVNSIKSKNEVEYIYLRNSNSDKLVSGF